MTGLRIGVLVRGFIVPAIALAGCGSPMRPSNTGPDAAADLAEGEPGTQVEDIASPADAGPGDAQQQGTESGPDAGALDLAEVGGPSPDVPGICQSPFGFPPNFAPPSVCPGMVLRTDAIRFDPADSRWSALYQGCLGSYGEPVSPGGPPYPDDCRKLCGTVPFASDALKYNQGINWCTLDCSEPQSPVLSVEYAITHCEPFRPDSGPPPLQPDAGPDAAPEAGRETAADLKTTIDAGGAGSQPRIALRQVSVYANCMPVISADPILVIWTVDITGASGSSAQLTKATITVSSSSATIVQDFAATVANPTIELASGAGTADQRKPIAVVSPNSACSQMCTGGVTYRLDLAYAIDGQDIPVTQSGNFMCAY